MKSVFWKADAASAIKRVEAVDLFKFIVLFFMIQGHLFRTYLLPTLKQTRWFVVHEILHGAVAPGFLFSAGFAAFLTYYRKRDQYRIIGAAFWTRARRILFVIGIGYWVHLPFLSLPHILRELPSGRIDDFLRIDILQCIGMGLLLFLLLGSCIKNENWMVGWVSAFALAFFLLPKVVKSIDIPFVLKAYLSHEISNFPLFPWLGFLFIGILMAFLFTRMNVRAYFWTLFALGAAMFPWYFFIQPKGDHKTELTLTGNLCKIGGVFLLMCIAQWMVTVGKGRWIALLKKAGRESLFVYALHLFIIFGSMFGLGLKPRFQDSLTVPYALVLFVILQALIFIASLGYGVLKEKRPRIWRLAFIVFWAGFFLFILFRQF